MDQQATTTRNLAADEKICSSCGEAIKIRAEICPKCGVRQRNPLSKAALLIITFFLGGIGAHKFYLGKYWQGILYLLFFWTGIPGLIALIEFIVYACTSSERLEEKYSPGSAGVVIAAVVGFFGIIAITGILAAIAIPQFASYRNRAIQHTAISDLQNLLAAEQTYFSQYNTYSPDIYSLDFTPQRQDVTIEIISADENCFEAQATHDNLPDPIVLDCNGIRQ